MGKESKDDWGPGLSIAQVRSCCTFRLYHNARKVGLETTPILICSLRYKRLTDSYYVTFLCNKSLLGRYYSRMKDGMNAKEQIHPDVDVGVKFLSDEDPENDWQGYRNLADAFREFGDDSNAIAS
jgi:hypothetical protein